jgi:propanol-preferring alcohol dehydrogenase
MRAMQLTDPAPIETAPLRPTDLPVPEPGPGQVRVKVAACGLCHTDLHTVEGELPLRRRPIVPGHQVVGRVDRLGEGVESPAIGDRVGMAWLHRTCGTCRFCRSGRENLCEQGQFTGWDTDGGYAEYTLIGADWAYQLPAGLGDVEATPLLCGGIIGFRALRLSGARKGSRLGLYGFGNSAHITIQIARHLGIEVYVYSRSERHRRHAEELGAAWVGEAGERAPHPLDAAILFAPAGGLVPVALEALDKGGVVTLAGIHMTPVPELEYERHLYHEKVLRSVANSTRQDGRDLLELAAQAGVVTTTTTFPLEEVNQALRMMKESALDGDAVLVL